MTTPHDPLTAEDAERVAQHVQATILEKFGYPGPWGKLAVATYRNATTAAQDTEEIKARLAAGVPAASFDVTLTAAVLTAALGRDNTRALAAELARLSS